MTSSIWKAVGVGAVSFFILPIIGIILMITGIGAFLGILCFLVWIVILLLSVFFSGISLGQLLMRRFAKEKNNRFLVNSLLGILVGYILVIIPFLGFIFFIFALWWGIGGVILYFANRRKAVSE
jgi:uncharacterized membrane-anchored protein